MTDDLKLGNVSSATIARIISLLVALFNEIAVSFNWYTLDIDDQNITQWVSLTFLVITAIINCWKNNSVTPGAIAGDKVMKRIKDKELSLQTVQDLLNIRRTPENGAAIDSILKSLQDPTNVALLNEVVTALKNNVDIAQIVEIIQAEQDKNKRVDVTISETA